ncbi:MAG TPA: hypothetical protein VK171_12480 [Fimbriimonas sp.]|nr:hypothetical protein [Fimbriimonas sp.]
MNLTGTWAGHFFWNDLKGDASPMDETSDLAFPVRMQMTDSGGQLEGQMTDTRTKIEFKAQEAFDLHKKNMDHDELADWKEWIEQNSEGVLTFQIPATSFIKGTRDDQDVVFMKTCVAPVTSEWVLPEESFGDEFDPIPIRCVGTVNEAACAIYGRYFFTKPTEEAKVWARNGVFKLVRIAE